MSDLRLPAIGAAMVAVVLTFLGPTPPCHGGDGAAQIALAETHYLSILATRPLLRISFVRAAAERSDAPRNDYPTATRADYVLGCMAANGNTREALLKCSCAIDTIAGLMPYSDYEKAETALSLQLGGGVGGRVGLFRDPPQIKAVIEELRRAQAEANLQCR
jgi:hypothetical protein